MNLLKVQTTALQAGKGKPGFAYFCEMGLGKTLTALTEFIDLVPTGITRLLVVCPNSFKAGWLDEIKKHGVEVDAFIFESGADYYNYPWMRKKFEKPPVLIMNYEAIRSESAQNFIIEYTRGRRCMAVLDESIQIKTYNSQQTKAALFISSLFEVKRVLSGKPATEGPHNLWAQMKFIGAIRENYFPFKTTFCKMGGFKGKKVVGIQNEELLAAKIDKFVFRASKKDWTDLPPKMYTAREYQLTAPMAAMYKSMEDDFVLWLNESEYVTVDAFITKYIKLAQIQSGFIYREDGKVAELVIPEHNPRFILVRELVEEATSKVVVPYVHRYTLNLLSRLLADYNPAELRGNMDPWEIQLMKDKFNSNPECRVILVQIRAGKYGHTLLGGEKPEDRCNTMVFAENSYSLDDRSQIEDRIHRHGQTADSCLYIDLWGTKLDRRITQALQKKEDIAKAVFAYFKKSTALD